MRTLFGLVLSVLLGLTGVASGAVQTTVLTSLPATHDLTAAVAKGTDITVLSVVSGNSRMKDHFGAFGDPAGNFSDLAVDADAVIHISGAWAADPLYPLARRHNIRVVDIDVSQPADPAEAGLHLLKIPAGEDEAASGALRRAGIASRTSPYVWLSLSNATRMAELGAGDLARLSPDSAGALEDNLRDLKGQIFRLRTEYEERFGEAESLTVLALTPDFVYLTDEWGMDVVDYCLEPVIRWTNEDYADFEREIAENDVKVVLCRWQPGEKLSGIIERAGARVVVLDLIDRTEAQGYLSRMKANLVRLAEALN